MELAKITSKGQITIPIQIRKLLNLKDGDKVAFLSEGNRIVVENSTRLAISDAHKAFAGLAQELGIETEDDLAMLVEEVRQEMWESRNAGND